MASSTNGDSNDANFLSTASDSLGLPKREVKLKIRMDNNDNFQNGSPKYHSLRYDFKPASVNSEEPSHMEITPTGQVIITAPNIEGSITNQTVFRGQRRPHVKECLLVIDKNTGEIILQKLTDNINVKATRSVPLNTTNNGTAANQNSSATTAIATNSITAGSSLGGTNNHTSIVSQNNSSSNNLTNNNHSNSGSSNSSHLGNSSCANNNNLTNFSSNEPQLSEESSSSSDSSDSSSSQSGSSRSRLSSSSSTSSSSSSNSGNSSPNESEGFVF